MSEEKKASAESGSGIPIMKREKSELKISGIKPPSVISVASSSSSVKTIRSCCSSTPKAGPPPLQRGKFCVTRFHLELFPLDL